MLSRALLLIALVSLIGCAKPIKPDTVVITDVAAPLVCPEPELPRPPEQLRVPLAIETPTLLPAGEGDYGITRDGIETLIDGYRALREREALWRAWAHDPR